MKWSVLLVAVLAAVGACRNTDRAGRGSADGSGAATADPAAELERRLRDDTGTRWFVTLDGERRAALVRIAGPVAPGAGSAGPSAAAGGEEAIARAFLARYAKTWGVNDVARELVMRTTSPVRVVFAQRTGSIVVDGAETIVRLEGGVVVGVDAYHVRDTATLPQTATITPDAARGAITDAVEAKLAGLFAAGAELTVPDLVYIAPDHRLPKLVYRALVRAEGAELVVTASADNGELVAIATNEREAVVAGSGLGVRAYFGPPGAVKQTFEVTQTGASFTMSRPATAQLPLIEVRRAVASKIGALLGIRCIPPSVGEVVTSWDPHVWDVRAPPDDRGNGLAVDVYVNLLKSAAFFAKKGLRSYDNKGSPLVGLIHAPGRSASWAGFSRVFYFGDATTTGGKTYAPPGVLDIVAHEYAHAVTESLWGGFGGDLEGGAIAEGVADVLAALVEHDRSPGPHNFTVGEETLAPGFRSFVAPAQDDGIDHYTKLIQMGPPPVDDGICDVGYDPCHENAGIINHAFYLMTNGGTNPTSKLQIAKGIGWPSAEVVWWSAVTKLTRNARLETLALETIAAAATAKIDLAPVACAWVAVGVLPGNRVKTGLSIDCAATDVTQDIVGHWDWAGWGKWGTMSFKRIKGQIRGAYTYRQGTVILADKNKDGWYRGCWSEETRDPQMTGEFGTVWFRLRPDGTLDGRWQHLSPKTWREDWDLARTKANAAIPSDDEARLTNDALFVPCP